MRQRLHGFRDASQLQDATDSSDKRQILQHAHQQDISCGAACMYLCIRVHDKHRVNVYKIKWYRPATLKVHYSRGPLFGRLESVGLGLGLGLLDCQNSRPLDLWTITINKMTAFRQQLKMAKTAPKV